MSFTHTSTFQIRYDECDAYGHLFHANYARLMQNTAFAASAAAGYDLEQYNLLGKLWLVHFTEIEFLRPARYGDIVYIKTWVTDFQRSSSRRAYEFYLHENKDLIARAYTDWVFVDTQTQRPATIPVEIQKAFFPDGVPTTFQPRKAFSPLPQKPMEVFCTHQRVNWKDIDTLGMVNNPCYLEYTTECGFQAVSHFGWSWERMANAGFAIIIRKAQVKYHQPARYGDELSVCTWVSDVKRATAIRHYEIKRVMDNALLASVNTTGVWIHLETGMPMRIPSDMLKDFSDNITNVNIEKGPL